MKKIHTKRLSIIGLSIFISLVSIVFIRMKQDKKLFDLKEHITYTWEDESGTLVLNTSDVFKTYHFAYRLQNEKPHSMTSVFVDREIRLTFDRKRVIYYDVINDSGLSLDRGEIHLEKALQEAIDISGYFFMTAEMYKIQTEVAFKSRPNELIAKGELAESLVDSAALTLYKEGVLIERHELEKMSLDRYHLTLNLEKAKDQSFADFNKIFAVQLEIKERSGSTYTFSVKPVEDGMIVCEINPLKSD